MPSTSYSTTILPTRHHPTVVIEWIGQFGVNGTSRTLEKWRFGAQIKILKCSEMSTKFLSKFLNVRRFLSESSEMNHHRFNECNTLKMPLFIPDYSMYRNPTITSS